MLGSDLAIGIAFSLFLFGVLQVQIGAPGRYYSQIAHVLAGFSYSLYVLHFPLLLFLRAWLTPPNRWQPDPTHLCYGVALGVVTLCFAWLVSVFTESKTHVARRWMKNALPHF